MDKLPSIKAQLRWLLEQREDNGDIIISKKVADQLWEMYIFQIEDENA